MLRPMASRNLHHCPGGAAANHSPVRSENPGFAPDSLENSAPANRNAGLAEDTAPSDLKGSAIQSWALQIKTMQILVTNKKNRTNLENTLQLHGGTPGATTALDLAAGGGTGGSPGKATPGASAALIDLTTTTPTPTPINCVSEASATLNASKRLRTDNGSRVAHTEGCGGQVAGPAHEQKKR